jgi:hypothetical protein
VYNIGPVLLENKITKDHRVMELFIIINTMLILYKVLYLLRFHKNQWYVTSQYSCTRSSTNLTTFGGETRMFGVIGSQ